MCECKRGDQVARVRNLFKVKGYVNGESCNVLIDCGANANFISREYAERRNLLSSQACGKVEMADGHCSVQAAVLSRSVNIRLGSHYERGKNGL